jgi:hypothetical protein
MAQENILGPFFAMMIVTLAVWLFMFARRIPFIQSSGLTPADLAVPGRLAEMSPPSISNPSDNLKNLFELPVLFYAIVLYLVATKRADNLDVVAAWVFVLFRAMHSIVHCTINLVMLRFWLYLAAAVALWFLILRAAAAWFAMPAV